MHFGIARGNPRGLASAPALVLTACLLWVTACTPSQVRYETVEPPAGGSQPLDATLYLVGDAGDITPGRNDVLSHLRTDLANVVDRDPGAPVLVAFLGDNIYDEGLPREPSEEDLAKLNEQVLALGDHPGVHGVFLPGNHDWANGSSVPDGRAAIARQSEWVEEVAPGRDIRFLPSDGCPGPERVDLGDTVRLLFIDTEWLLRRPEERCGTALHFYGRFAEELRESAGRHVVVLAHHPLVSGGPHGGNVAPLQMGPFVYYLARKSGASVQDISSRRYATVVRRIQEAVTASGVRPLAFAAGHDHTLQVIGMSGPGAPAYQLVSGAGSKSERTMWIPGMRFAKEGYGYMRLDFRAGEVLLTVFARDPDAGPVGTVFGCALSADPADGGCAEAPRLDEAP